MLRRLVVSSRSWLGQALRIESSLGVQDLDHFLGDRAVDQLDVAERLGGACKRSLTALDLRKDARVVPWDSAAAFVQPEMKGVVEVSVQG